MRTKTAKNATSCLTTTKEDIPKIDSKELFTLDVEKLGESLKWLNLKVGFPLSLSKKRYELKIAFP